MLSNEKWKMQNTVRIKSWMLIIAFFIGVLVTICGTLIFIHPTDRVIKTWKQSDDVKYDAFGPYYLSVVEADIDISRLPFSMERRYYIYVGRDSGKLIHGHVIEYSFHPEVSNLYNVAAHINKSTVIWSAEGVTFEEASGHKVFIPKNMIGGR